jgi:intracellular multiplication protein IcmD
MSYVRCLTYCYSTNKKYVFFLCSLAIMLCGYAPYTWAGGTTPPLVGFGAYAENVNLAIPAFTTLVVSIGYLAGITFAVIGIMKFKQHKENPQQVPLGTPITMILVAAGLVFLPTMIESTGSTLTGEEGTAVMGSPDQDPTTTIWGKTKAKTTTTTTTKTEKKKGGL